MDADKSSQDIVIRVPKNTKKSYSVMSFHASSNVDVSKWSHAKMERENNMADLSVEQGPPTTGAGSEFGRESGKKFKSRAKCNPEAQPWVLKPDTADSKDGKTFRGIKQGGITDNCDYYVFVQASDGAFEAYPVENWYNFTHIPKHKTLNDEQAEAAFANRGKVFNYFKVMKKEVDDETLDGVKGFEEKKIKMSKDQSREEGATKRKKVAKSKETKKYKPDDESGEESADDGDLEGAEVDYISDLDSDGDEDVRGEPTNMKGIEDEEANRETDETDESDEEKEEKKVNLWDEKPPVEMSETTKLSSSSSSSSATSSSGSESDDFDDGDFKSALFMSGANTGKGQKRKAETTPKTKPKAKKSKKTDKTVDPVPVFTPKPDRTDIPVLSPGRGSSEFEVLEAKIRKLLKRKPMSTTEILKSVKTIKSIPKEQYIKTVAEIIKRIKPQQKLVEGKMFLFLK